MWPFKKKTQVVALATNLPTPVAPSASITVPPVVAQPQVRLPRIGDKVWWAPKELECTVVSVGLLGFTFVGGEDVKDSKGRLRPRWTVSTGFDHKFDEDVGSWLVGHGRTPKNVRGIVVTPEPVKVDLSAYLPRNQ